VGDVNYRYSIAPDHLLALLEIRDAQDAFSRAIGWGVLVTHADTPEALLGLYGPFSEPASALEYAARQERDLNEGEETGFRCRVEPIMPAS